jgi:hypothetical protein
VISSTFQPRASAAAVKNSLFTWQAGTSQLTHATVLGSGVSGSGSVTVISVGGDVMASISASPELVPVGAVDVSGAVDAVVALVAAVSSSSSPPQAARTRPAATAIAAALRLSPDIAAPFEVRLGPS